MGVERLDTVTSGRDPVPLGPEGTLNRFPNRRLVVDHQDLGEGHAPAVCLRNLRPR
jgi:hypothetical protein